MRWSTWVSGDQNFLIPGCKVHWTISVEIILDGISCSDFYFSWIKNFIKMYSGEIDKIAVVNTVSTILFEFNCY